MVCLSSPRSARLAVLLLLFARWCYRTTHVHAAIGVLRFLLRWLQNLYEQKDEKRTTRCLRQDLLGRSTIRSHQHSSSHRHYRTPRNNLGPKTVSPSVVLRKTHIRPQRPKGQRCQYYVKIVITRYEGEGRTRSVKRPLAKQVTESANP